MAKALAAVLTVFLALQCFGAATQPSTRPSPRLPAIASQQPPSFNALSSTDIGYAINDLESYVRKKTALDLESIKDDYGAAKQVQREVEKQLSSLDAQDPRRIDLASENLNIRKILSEMEQDATDDDVDLHKAKAALVQLHGVLIARNAATPFIPSPTAGTNIGSTGPGPIVSSYTSLKSNYQGRQNSSSGGSVFVGGYRRQDGTYVNSYYRRRPRR